MALLQQWHRQRPWLMAGVAALGASIGAVMPWNWSTSGVISTKVENPWEHPLRRRIIQVLERQPGLAYRELQRELGAANGTLRHHLDVLISNRSITVVPVNGRSCHYAGAPQQVEILREMNVGDAEKAARMMPVGLSGAQRMVVARLVKSPPPRSQAELSRELGRSRATIHSAIKVLRRRGIVHSHELKMAPHLEGLQSTSVQYEWLDERPLPE
ncbi:MAG: winged helix-turn-helix transcriptional regulator [Candidatus Thalassarchaeaceae archaeon]|nr:winged helix-turn-helix transcriptional regulator [Candidatus Thalassarchaeaceae archaeon]